MITYRGQYSDEELTAVRIRTSIRHAHRVRSIVLQRRHKLVLEIAAPNRLTSGSGARWVTRLHHKALDHAMENVTVVVARLAVHAKVLHRFGALGGEQLHVHIAQRCVNGGRAVDTLDTCGYI